jgi:GT2 family glycosyltransferase
MSLNTPAPAFADVVDVSVVIITKDRHGELLKTLEVLKSTLDGRNAEIVVVEETDLDTPVGGVKYVNIPEKGLGFGHARNIGLENARGQVICFLDDDCQPDASWLNELISSLEAGADGVGGAILPQGTNGVGCSVALLGFPAGGLARMIDAGGKEIPSPYISTGNCAIRSRVLERVGKFKENFCHGGEDQEFFERLSADTRTLYNPNAVVFHKQRDSFRSIFFWFFRRGRADSHLFKQQNMTPARALSYFRGSLTLRAAAFCLLVLIMGWQPALWILLLYLLSFTVVVLYRIWRRHKIHDPVMIRRIGQYREKIFTTKAWLLTPLTKMIMDVGCEMGKWTGFFGRKGSRL